MASRKPHSRWVYPYASFILDRSALILLICLAGFFWQGFCRRAGNVYAFPVHLEFAKPVYIVPERIELNLFVPQIPENIPVVDLAVCNGDSERLTLQNDPCQMGFFSGSLLSETGEPIPQDGIFQIEHNSMLLARYYYSDPDSGNILTIQQNVLVGTAEDMILQADFSQGLPGGWTVVDGFNDGQTWNADNPGSWSNDYWNGRFMIVDSDYAGNVVMDEELITPPINCEFYKYVTLSFSHFFVYYDKGLDEMADVDVRVGEGGWINVARFTGQNAFGKVKLDLSAIVDGRGGVQVRWHYYNARNEYYWGIDNVIVSGVAAPAVLGGDYNFDCDVDLRDFAFLSRIWLSRTDDKNWSAQNDISEPSDGIINLQDLLVLINNWMR